jgi:hypothetical protein
VASISLFRRVCSPLGAKAALLVAIVLALLAATLSPVRATPKPTVADVMKKLTALSHKAEQLTEQYNKAAQDVKAKQTKAARPRSRPRRRRPSSAPRPPNCGSHWLSSTAAPSSTAPPP